MSGGPGGLLRAGRAGGGISVGVHTLLRATSDRELRRWRVWSFAWGRGLVNPFLVPVAPCLGDAQTTRCATVEGGL